MNGHDNEGNPIIGYSSAWLDDEKHKLWLGHSCDHWVIGTVNEAREFIKKLESVIEQAEKFPEKAVEPDEY